jgi:redox-sensitive bicupin YhaK (pirin superfamily)
MSTEMNTHDDPEMNVETVVVPRTHDLGDGFNVRQRAPHVDRRMVGPFVFLDQMGPHVFQAGRGIDVRPHPHIGLSTVTYLLEGEISHRDSLGTVQDIRPGEVNWMTAGSGIVHSERTGPGLRAAGSTLSGLQCWVALPRAKEEKDPSFSHFKATELPMLEGEGVTARIIAGAYFGKRAPVPVESPMFYVDLQLAPGARLALPAEYPEQALYIVQGTLDLGRDGSFQAGQLVVLKPGAKLTVAAGNGAGARVMLLGGEPMDGPRYLTWNFVSSSADRIEQAKQDWRAMRFPAVPGETEFIPLPDLPGRPVHYP